MNIRNKIKEYPYRPVDNTKKIRASYKKTLFTYIYNLDKMDQSLKNHKLPKFTKYEIHNINSPIAIKEIESMF